jgi:hypothetical protein
MTIGPVFQGVKRPERGVYHPPLLVQKLRKCRAILLLLLFCIFMAFFFGGGGGIILFEQYRLTYGPSRTGLFLRCGPGLCHVVIQLEQNIVLSRLNRILSLKSKSWVFKSGWFLLLRTRQVQISHLAEHMAKSRRCESHSIILKAHKGSPTVNSLSCTFRS